MASSFTNVAVIASILGSAVLIMPAEAKPRGGASLLSLCISNLEGCTDLCGDLNPLPSPNYLEKNCLNQCDANHAACVDAAFSFAARTGNRDVLWSRPVSLRKQRSSSPK
jgi:hypothetical protein